MTPLTRRAMLRTTALAPVTFAVGCSGLTAAVPQFVTDANTIAAGLTALLPSLTTITGVSAATITQIQAWIAEAQSLAASLAAAASAGGGTAVFRISLLKVRHKGTQVT